MGREGEEAPEEGDGEGLPGKGELPDVVPDPAIGRVGVPLWKRERHDT